MFIINKSNKNPYTRQIIHKNKIRTISKIIKLSRILNDKIVLTLEDETDSLTEQQKIEFKALDLFQKMDAFGYVTNRSWFLDLSVDDLHDFISELLDIWNYRVSINFETKCRICPPSGYINTNHFTTWRERGEEYMKKKALGVIEQLITNGVTDEDKKLGTLYILGALTIISQNAANSLPWLYDSFRLNNQQHV